VESKGFPITNVKALGDGDPDGTFEAIVSVFGNIDRYGDRVEPGAFAESLKSGFPPIVWSHQWGTPPIGVSLEAKEVEEGLYVKGQLFVAENELARQVYAAMKSVGGDGQPALKEFSFSYDIVTAGWETEDEEEFFSLKELSIIEVGPCLKGVNEETRLIGVKGEQRLEPLKRERPPKPGEKSEDDQVPNSTPEAEPQDDQVDDAEAKAEARARAAELLMEPPPSFL
jgi:uncharacterized protein